MPTNLPEERVGGQGEVWPPEESSFVEGLGQSMRALEAVIRELARGEVPVLLLAEAGAGKEAAARRIHQLSAHREEPFRMVQCSGLTVHELQTFGNGADGIGTLYLEDVANLSSTCQESFVEILPRLEGDGNGKGRGVRLVCGSSQDLETEVRAGRFREDLYYRISGVCLRIPPLRQRKEDIPQLTRFFLDKFARDFRRPVPGLSSETLKLFREYGWPGNIRELEDAARAIVVLGDEGVAMEGLRHRWTRLNGGEGEFISLKQASRAASREAEKELILRVLNRTRWNRRRAARELQISYKALLYKLKQIVGQDFGVS